MDDHIKSGVGLPPTGLSMLSLFMALVSGTLLLYTALAPAGSGESLPTTAGLTSGTDVCPDVFFEGEEMATGKTKEEALQNLTRKLETTCGFVHYTGDPPNTTEAICENQRPPGYPDVICKAGTSERLSGPPNITCIEPTKLVAGTRPWWQIWNWGLPPPLVQVPDPKRMVTCTGTVPCMLACNPVPRNE